jgi:hypothetical protein
MSNEENEKKPRELKITVDSEQMKQLAMDLAKEQLKVSALTEKVLDKNEDKRIIFKDEEDKNIQFNSSDTLEKRKLQAYEKFHQEKFLKAESKQELNDMITNLVNEVAEKRKEAPEGSAPLNSQQMGFNGQDDLYKHRFQNEKELVSTLRDLAHSGSEEAKSYLDALMVQFIKSKKQNPNSPDNSYDSNSPENLPLLKREGQFLTPVRKEEGDIGKILEAWKRERNAKRESGKQ